MNAPVLTLLRQRSPFLFANSFVPTEDPDTFSTFYQFHGSEPFFAGHFPGDPIVPGVLLIEGMAQAARIALCERFRAPSKGFIVGIERARFTRLVRPPETVRFTARLKPTHDGQAPQGFFEATCSAFVGEERAARADLKITIR